MREAGHVRRIEAAEEAIERTCKLRSEVGGMERHLDAIESPDERTRSRKAPFSRSGYRLRPAEIESSEGARPS